MDAPTRDVWLSDSDDEAKHRDKMPRDEGYAVTKGRMKDIIMRLQVGLPTVDAFASREMRVCKRRWGRGSEHPDPLHADWSKEDLIWCKPPFRQMPQVVSKLLVRELGVYS